jgi:protease stability complex PrcB-like protein
MRMLTRRLGQSILWATATSVALGAPLSNAVEWKAYRFYFPNSISAMGLWRSSSADRSNERTFDVVHSQAEWSAYLEPFFKPRSEVAATITPYPPIPEPPIDFDKFTLLIASMGMKPTGGFGIEFASIRDDGTTLVASVLETVPGKYCGLTQTVTRPTAQVLIARTTKQVEFEVSTTIHECPP